MTGYTKCRKCKGTGIEPDGRQFRLIRLEKGISLRALARCLGISPAYLSEMETGKRLLNDRRAEVILEALKRLRTDPDANLGHSWREG